jgi:hypothetical protein
MTEPRVPLFDRLPEIYRVRDAEAVPPNQLRAYLAAIETAFEAVRANIGQLYEDLFIDTCDDWVIPYIADLLGTTHLSGDPRTLRADVADTVALRRRKGTLAAIERLAANLTGWACRTVELRENLVWAQHLNHQRPDAGGLPPYGGDAVTRFTVPRGGTAPIRDPAALALIGTPFDPFAYTPDVKPALDGIVHINLPNLAIFLWRLVAYPLTVVQPLAKGVSNLGPPPAGLARFAIRYDLDPLDRPVRLFNTRSPGFQQAAAADEILSPLIEPDAVPGPMLDARISTDTETSRPDAYVAVDFFDDSATPPKGLDRGEVGLQFFLPQSAQTLFAPEWRCRGDNLCAWETGLRQPLRDGEIVVDPDIGRVLFGVGKAAQRNALVAPLGSGFTSRIYARYAYGAAGPVGAHPISREAVPSAGFDVRPVSALPGGVSLQSQLDNLANATQPVVIEIGDSLLHRVDLAAIPDTAVDGGPALRLAQSLTIRAMGGHRPIVLLTSPLAFRPTVAAAATTDGPVVRLEGLYLARDPAAFPAGAALIARAALARLEIIGCTLDPGGHSLRDGTRAPLFSGMLLANGYGFALASERNAFVPTPDIIIQRSITGALGIDDRYRLDVSASIIDAGLGIGDPASSAFAIAAATHPVAAWGAPLVFDGVTCLGPVRVSTVSGDGAIFAQRFEVLDNQHGCIKRSWFSDDGDRLPPNHFCVHAADARVAFTSERFGDPGYAQLADGSDRRVRTRGPDDDAMGAFGFMRDAHKWANLQIRLREFMPVGVRPLVVPVT